MGDEEGKSLYVFCRPGKLISGCQSLWHVKHFHNSANVAFNLCSGAELSFCRGTWWKIATKTSSSCGVFKMDTKSLIQLKNCLCWNRQKQKNSHVPGSQAVKSEPSAVEIPVIPLTLTLMCFSLDRPVWNTGRVTWHYKCLFIKLSLQVISLGSCVLVHFFLYFPHFSEIR